MFRPYGLPVFLLIVIAFCPILPAQSTEAQSPPAGSPSGWTATTPLQVSATGCLKRGNGGQYVLSDLNGTSWTLTSSSVDLAKHVNHSVTVTGKPASSLPQQEGSPQGSGNTATGAEPQNALRVLTLKMLSPSCTR